MRVLLAVQTVRWTDLRVLLWPWGLSYSVAVKVVEEHFHLQNKLVKRIGEVNKVLLSFELGCIDAQNDTPDQDLYSLQDSHCTEGGGEGNCAPPILPSLLPLYFFICSFNLPVTQAETCSNVNHFNNTPCLTKSESQVMA